MRFQLPCGSETLTLWLQFVLFWTPSMQFPWRRGRRVPGGRCTPRFLRWSDLSSGMVVPGDSPTSTINSHASVCFCFLSNNDSNDVQSKSPMDPFPEPGFTTLPKRWMQSQFLPWGLMNQQCGISLISWLMKQSHDTFHSDSNLLCAVLEQMCICSTYCAIVLPVCSVNSRNNPTDRISNWLLLFLEFRHNWVLKM